MISLFLSVFTSLLLTISFKVLEILKINSFHSIVINYFIAAFMGFYMTDAKIEVTQIASQPWFYITLILGPVFIILLNVFSYTSVKLGITVAGVANRMSIVIPVSIAMMFYGDKVNTIKIAGLLIALAAIYFTTVKEKTEDNKIIDKKLYLLPLAIFVFSGLIDTLVNFAQRNYLDDKMFPLFLSMIFVIAGLIGMGVLLIQLFRNKTKVKPNAIFAGIIIGLINYCTMHFIVECLNENIFEPSVLFPINHMSVLTASTLTAFFIFREKLSLKNRIGILMALASIIIISFS